MAPTSKAALDQQARDRLEIDRLKSQNPSFSDHLPRWLSYVNAVEGGEAFANKAHLHRHAREHEKDFEDRARRLHYDNILEGLVDFFTNFIFSETILRDGGQDNDWYQLFLKDVDKKGSDIEKFMREICDDMQVYGHLYILVDAPTKPEWVKTKFDEEKAGLRPYWVKITPDEIIDWVIDPFDKLLYAKRQQEIDQFDETTMSVRRLKQFTEWSNKKIQISLVDESGDKPVLVEQTQYDNTTGEVPLTVCRYRRSRMSSFIGNSFLRNLVLCAKAILNRSSLEDEFLYRQCFNILAMEAEETLPFKDQEEGDTGTSNALVYPKGAKPPQYIAPSADPAKYIVDSMQRIEAQMFRYAAQDMMNELFNGSNASGFGKAMSFSKTVPHIASRADTLERTERELMRLTMVFLKKPWTGSIKYKDRYEITSLTDWLTQLTIIFSDLGLESETFMRSQMKKSVALFDGKFTPDERKKIDAEIDAIDFQDWFQKVGPLDPTLGMNADGTGTGGKKPQPKISPASQQRQKSAGTMSEVQQESQQLRNSEQEPRVVNSATKRVRGTNRLQSRVKNLSQA